MTLLLASVRSPEEAAIALAGGADVIDLKEPAAGALGRLPEATVHASVAAIAGRRPVSATIGDMALEPRAVLAAVREMAALGVDIVKVGIFDGDVAGMLDALAGAARDGIRLVAVLFADRAPDLALVEACAASGFHGVMLDTADKAAGPLTRHLDTATLRSFVAAARARMLLTGLAGSLGLADIAPLTALAPDYLGFRSALTRGGRAGPLSAEAVAAVRAAIAQASPRSSATATAGAASDAASASAPVAPTRLAKSR
jgi:uncharacterized protein (UPF0264 family)